MRDDDRHPPRELLLELGEDRGFRLGVEVRGRLVEDPQVGAAIDQPGEPLPLSTGEVVTAVEQITDAALAAPCKGAR